MPALPRRLTTTLALVLFTSVGCSAKLTHRSIDIPIVLGERLHVGPSPTFRCAELMEVYYAENLTHTLTGYGVGEYEHVDNAWQVAGAVAAGEEPSAIRGVTIQGMLLSVVTPFGGGKDVSLIASGDVVGILEPRQMDCKGTR